MLIVKDKSPSSLTLSSLCMLEAQQSKATPLATKLETGWGGRGGVGKGGRKGGIQGLKCRTHHSLQ